MNTFISVIFITAFYILIIKYIKVKKQIKDIRNQLRDKRIRRRFVSIELFDKDIDSLTIEINHLIEENNQMLLDAKESNDYLKNCIADISHDMRTPLTSSIGYLQLLGRSDLNDSQRQHLNTALDKSKYLRELMSDFFELSVLSANDTVPEYSKIDLAGIVSETILEHSNEFEERKITPVFETADTPAFILANSEMLKRVIQNLISNCLKYSYGDVVFMIKEENETIQLTIQNPVLSMEDIDVDRMFHRFYRADSARNGQGVGLGLSIVRLLVEKMGGSISASAKSDSIVVQLSFPKFL